ncbi:MAG: glutathione ABC transporter substrate-binding protein [Spirochaetia bacterium]|nr:glutathione ABC transporter substrate-binding protein [Spirochaetia bacterium]
MKKVLLLLLVLVMMSPVFARGAAEVAAESKATDKGTLVVAMQADARSLDPQATNDQPSARVMKQIYETLMYQDEELNISNGLATSYEVLSPTEYKFTLKRGVKFHNGEELTANDVKFTFERMRAVNAPGGFLVDALDRVEVIDNYTFKMILKFPFGPFITHLAHPATAIINEKAVNAAGQDYGRNPVGTGPFKFVEWRSSDSIVLDRFNDYHGENAKSQRIRFRIISEDTNRAIALETGEVDIIYDVNPNDFGGLVEKTDIVTFQTTGLTTFYLGFNVAKAPFDNIKVRQAINLALDVDLATEVAFMGYATAAKGPLAPTVLFANQDLPGYGYDPARAKQLLAEAGYPNGFTTTIWTNDNPIRIRYAEIFQAQLNEVGIRVRIEIMEFAPYLDRTAQGEHDMFMLGWVAVTGDADYGLYSLFHSTTFGDAGNRTFWANSEVDRLLDFAKQSPDFAERERAYARAQEIVFEEAPWVFLAFRDDLNATRNWVEGFKPHAAGHHRLYAVYNK